MKTFNDMLPGATFVTFWAIADANTLTLISIAPDLPLPGGIAISLTDERRQLFSGTNLINDNRLITRLIPTQLRLALGGSINALGVLGAGDRVVMVGWSESNPALALTTLQKQRDALFSELDTRDAVRHFQSQKDLNAFAIDGLHESVVLIDMLNNSATINASAGSLLGIAGGSPSVPEVNQALRDLIANAANALEIREQAVQLLGDPQASIKDWLWQLKDGRWLSVDCEVFRDNNHYGRVWSFRDHTSQMNLIESNNRLVEANELSASTFAALVDPSGVLQAMRSDSGEISDFKFINANQYLADYFGMPLENLIGSTMLQIMPTLSETPLFGELKDVVETGRSLETNDRKTTSVFSGQEIYVDLRATKVRDGFLYTFRDKTDAYKSAELIADSESRYRMLAENTTDVIAVSRDGVYLWLSQSATAAFGWHPEELVGKRHEDFVHPDDRVFMASARDQVQQGITKRIRYRYRNKAGLYNWISVAANPMKNDAGEFQGVLVSARIVDDEVENELRLKAASELAELAVIAKSSFLANMSHEIRTPLTGLIGVLQLLRQSNLNAEQNDYLASADASASHLLALLNDILDFSKIEAKSLSLDVEPFDLSALIAEVKSIILPTARQAGLAFEVETAITGGIWLLGDALRLKQVFLNLLGNAVKFTRVGSVKMDVRCLSSADAKTTLRFTFSDTGIGMSQEVQERIFRSFEQGDQSTSRQFGGTGLGLAISSELVKLMGGIIEVSSEPGVGSTFTFTLNFDVPNAAPAMETSQNLDEQTISGLKLLVVEDNEINSRIAVELLRRQGAQVESAANGLEALSSFRSAEVPFDAVLMDLQMPVLDGYAAAKALRSEFGDGPVIIALSANTSGDEAKACLDAGMNDYVHKPFDLKVLTRVIATQLAIARLKKSGLGQGQAIFDEHSALERLGGDRDFLTKMVGQFKSQLQGVALRLTGGVLPVSTIQDLAHSLRGSSATLGMNRLAEASERLETSNEGVIGVEVIQWLGVAYETMTAVSQYLEQIS